MKNKTLFLIEGHFFIKSKMAADEMGVGVAKVTETDCHPVKVITTWHHQHHMRSDDQCTTWKPAAEFSEFANASGHPEIRGFHTKDAASKF